MLDVDSGGGGGMFGAAIIGTVRFGSALYPGAEINISGRPQHRHCAVSRQRGSATVSVNAIHLQFEIWGCNGEQSILQLQLRHSGW